MPIVLAIILALLTVYFAREFWHHRANLRRVPIRVHVNGTRGKSSVTRLIAAGLRAGGIRTCAKTTGSRPRMILEDGSEYSIQRQGRANIIEQVRAVGTAARREAQALVAECMALLPRYQYLCEHSMLRSRVGVITNARADHLDVMGPTVKDLTKALCGTVPRRATLVTGETEPELVAIMQEACRRQRSTLIVATPESEGIQEEMLRGFGYVEHPDNLAVALRACQELGVEPRVALEGMWRCQPDIGVLRIIELAFYAKQIRFVNALAANDPDSTLAIWRNRILVLFPGEQQRVVLLNCRADRPHRSLQLGEMVTRMERVDRLMLTGTGTRLGLEAALRAGLDPERVIELEQASPAQVFERAVAQVGKQGLVFGMGNVGAGGNEIVEYFQNRASLPEQAA